MCMRVYLYAFIVVVGVLFGLVDSSRPSICQCGVLEYGSHWVLDKGYTELVVFSCGVF